jgi:hypothetical protein
VQNFRGNECELSAGGGVGCFRRNLTWGSKRRDCETTSEPNETKFGVGIDEMFEEMLSKIQSD